ncbi:MAG TPA: hypothetical protein VHA06_17850 [Candidatus Angelobacter sp.]|jgi:hypothetical protein|nr:hypothetical protein [Candidatus Angelobacter sp.]
MVRDSNGNPLKEGDFVMVELKSQLVKGQVQQIFIHGGPSLAVRPELAQGRPTQIVVMCPVQVTLHPQQEIAVNITTMVKPETEPAGSPLKQ